MFKAIAVMGQAVASATRLELLDLSSLQAARTVEELARAERAVDATLAAPQALHAAGMVTRAREGTQACAARDRLKRPGRSVRRLALRISVAQLAGGRAQQRTTRPRGCRGDRLEELGPSAFAAATWCWSTCVQRRRFAASAIDAGARSILLDELEQRLAELPANARGRSAAAEAWFLAYAHETSGALRAATGARRRLLRGGFRPNGVSRRNLRTH